MNMQTVLLWSSPEQSTCWGFVHFSVVLLLFCSAWLSASIPEWGECVCVCVCVCVCERVHTHMCVQLCDQVVCIKEKRLLTARSHNKERHHSHSDNSNSIICQGENHTSATTHTCWHTGFAHTQTHTHNILSLSLSDRLPDRHLCLNRYPCVIKV